MYYVRDNKLPLFNDEILQVVPEWDDLLKIDNKLVCVHTILVLYLTFNDEDYLKLS